MKDSLNDFNFPSGVQLPIALRGKVDEQKAKAAAAEQEGVKQSTLENYTFMTAVQGPPEDFKLFEDQLESTFPSEELESRIWKATVAMVEVQKQIQRGEEAYYDETFNRGNIFKGWEGYLDARDVGNSDGVGGRRVPADFRWFSNSCKSIPRNPRPSPLTISASQQQQQQNPAYMGTGSATPMSVSSVSATPAAAAYTATSNSAAQMSFRVSSPDPAPSATASATDEAATEPGNPAKRPTETLLDQKIPKKKMKEEATQDANGEDAKDGSSSLQKNEESGPKASDAVQVDAQPPSTGKKRGRKRKTAES